MMKTTFILMLVLGHLMVGMMSKKLVYSYWNLTENQYMVNTTDAQVLYIAAQANKKFNIEHAATNYIHLMRVEEATIQITSGIVYSLRALVSPTDCKVKDLDFTNKTLKELGSYCKAESNHYEKYYCRFEGKVNPGSLDFELITVACVL